MCARALAAVAAFVALGIINAYAQDGIYIEVADRNSSENEDIEKRMTPQLIKELNTAKSTALLLYTEYTAKAGSDMKTFLGNISKYADEALRSVERRPVSNDIGNCRPMLEEKLKKIEMDAYVAATYSGENHHKFLLGHMVVFRMHLNKTEEYIRKCDRALYGCGLPCENKPKVKRWKRLALEEIHRVKDDIQHSRRSYKDLVAHAKRRLNHLRKQINIRTTDAVEDYHKCLGDNYKYDK